MKRVIFNLDDREALNLKVLLEKYGGKAPAFFKRYLFNAFEKEFGSYKARGGNRVKTIKEKIVNPILTVEQMCEALGGRVGTNEFGIRICENIPVGPKAKIGIPLNKKAIMEAKEQYHLKDKEQHNE